MKANTGYYTVIDGIFQYIKSENEIKADLKNQAAKKKRTDFKNRLKVFLKKNNIKGEVITSGFSTTDLAAATKILNAKGIAYTIDDRPLYWDNIIITNKVEI